MSYIGTLHLNKENQHTVGKYPTLFDDANHIKCLSLKVLVNIIDTDCTNKDLFNRKSDFRDDYTYSQSAHEGSGEENNNTTLSDVLRFHFAC